MKELLEEYVAEAMALRKQIDILLQIVGWFADNGEGDMTIPLDELQGVPANITVTDTEVQIG